MTNETYDPNDVNSPPISFERDNDKIGFFEKYKIFIILIILIALGYFFKDQILSLFNSSINANINSKY